MTVKKLIKKLEQFDETLPILGSDDYGNDLDTIEVSLALNKKSVDIKIF